MIKQLTLNNHNVQGCKIEEKTLRASIFATPTVIAQPSMAATNGATNVAANGTAGTLKCFPGPNPARCFWQDERDEFSDYRSTETLPEDADIVIIGAGYAGVSTAYHLTEQDGGATKSICILEARAACSGATGRNGGHCRPDFYGHIPTYMDRAGARAGAEIAEFEIATLRDLKMFIDQEKIDCNFTLTRSLDVWCNKNSAQKALAVYQRMAAEMFEYMDDVVFYTGEKVPGVSRHTKLHPAVS